MDSEASSNILAASKNTSMMLINAKNNVVASIES